MTRTLTVEVRDTKTRADMLRESGKVPGVVYGAKHAAQSISIDARVFGKLWKEAGETTVLSLEGAGVPVEALIKEVTFDPITGHPVHVDFYALEKGKKVTVMIPIEFIGEAPVEKVGGVVHKVGHEIEIEVAPADLPQHLDVDLSGLENIGDHIVAKDIPLPASATLVSDEDEVIVTVTEPHEEKEEEPATPVEGEATEDAQPQESETTE